MAPYDYTDSALVSRWWQVVLGNNSRDLSWLAHWLYVTFGQWKWARRAIGGKWEQWWVEGTCSYIWHPVRHWSDDAPMPAKVEAALMGFPDPRHRPSPLCQGTPLLAEEWSGADSPTTFGRMLVRALQTRSLPSKPTSSLLNG